MEARRATVHLIYNGANATGSIAPSLAGFSYTDVASGSSDSISVEFTGRRWIGPWFPMTGDKLVPTIQTFNWSFDGQFMAFPCGAFVVDDFSFSGGPPIGLSLEALAIPTDSSFKTTKRTITYEDATLQEIGQEIADRAGIALVYEATPPISIKRVEQSNQDDCEFYNKLVGEYGLQLKIYNNRLVVFSEADYEAKAPKVALTEADFEPNWSFNTSLLGVYTGVKYQYTNPDKNKTYTVEAGDGNRILTCNDAADNLGEAISVALAAINKANRGTTTMTLTMKAIPGLIATDCVAIVGLQKLDGKYYIEKITHSVGSGYKMALTLRRVEKRFTSPTKAVESSA